MLMQMAHVLRHAPPKGDMVPGASRCIEGVRARRSWHAWSGFDRPPPLPPMLPSTTAAQPHPLGVLCKQSALSLMAWAVHSQAALHGGRRRYKVGVLARHSEAAPCNVAEVDAAGFVPLPVLLRELRAPGADEAAVCAIVASDNKGRHQLDDSTAPPRIRAVQGHSVQLAEPELRPVSSAHEVRLAVHLTSQEGWAAIQVQAQSHESWC